MRNNIIGATALAVAVLISGSAFAGDHGPDPIERQKLDNSFQRSSTFGYPSSTYTRPEGFTIRRMISVGDGDAYAINGAATPEAVEALQASILSDAALTAELRSHSVQIKNIIGSAKAFNGRTIYYVQ